MISHPSPSLKWKFLENAFESGRPFALFLPFLTLASIQARELFTQYSMTVLVFSRNVTFHINGNNERYHMDWFCGKVGGDNHYVKLIYLG